MDTGNGGFLLEFFLGLFFVFIFSIIKTIFFFFLSTTQIRSSHQNVGRGSSADGKYEIIVEHRLGVRHFVMMTTLTRKTGVLYYAHLKRDQAFLVFFSVNHIGKPPMWGCAYFIQFIFFGAMEDYS